MPNTHSTLTGLFTDIADAIREKDGTSAPKVADAFPAAIRAIPTGGDTDAEDELVERTLSGTYVNARVSKIGTYAFYGCTSLSAVSFPACVTIESYAFGNCSRLTTVSFLSCTTIGSYAFSSCSRLTTVSFPVCTMIEGSAFYSCTSLTAVSFPVCTTIKGSAFYGCRSLLTISFPACTTIENYAFYNCSRLTTVSFPTCTTIGSGAFRSCYGLSAVSFPVCATIMNSAFYSCTHLLSLYLFASTVCNLSSSNAFTSTPIGGYTESTGGVYGSVFVPMSLLSAYKAATNWTYFADRIVGVDPEDM